MSVSARVCRVVVMALVVSLAAGIQGCGTKTSNSKNAASTDHNTREFVDDLERTVRLPVLVNRVVSLSPAATETLFAIGAGEKVVGVTKFADYPAEVVSLPRVGGFVTESLSLERIVELKPDLVISAGSLQIGIVEQLEQLEVPTIAFEPNSLDAIVLAVRRMGDAVGMRENADRVADQLLQRISAIEKRLEGVDRPAVYYEVASKPLMAAGPKSFIGELLRRAGARNIFEATMDEYPFINPEEVVRQSPQIILVPDHPGAVNGVLTRNGWHLIEAVREKRVFTINEGIVSRAGPRIGDGLELIARAIHPERFSDASP